MVLRELFLSSFLWGMSSILYRHRFWHSCNFIAYVSQRVVWWKCFDACCICHLKRLYFSFMYILGSLLSLLYQACAYSIFEFSRFGEGSYRDSIRFLKLVRKKICHAVLSVLTWLLMCYRLSFTCFLLMVSFRDRCCCCCFCIKHVLARFEFSRFGPGITS